MGSYFFLLLTSLPILILVCSFIMLLHAGCVTASDGNFALSLSYLCAYFQVKAHIFLPSVTLKHKVDNILRFGKEFVEVKLVEANYEETVEMARKYSQGNNNNHISHLFSRMR